LTIIHNGRSHDDRGVRNPKGGDIPGNEDASGGKPHLRIGQRDLAGLGQFGGYQGSDFFIGDS
jgi:hypothetical protein